MLEYFNQIISSPITNVVLTLFLVFQWYKQHAKEQSVKYNLFSIRRMISRIPEITDTHNIKQKADDLVDALDATLATLGARNPFTKRMQEIVNAIEKRFYKESVEELKRLPNEIEKSIEK